MFAPLLLLLLLAFNASVHALPSRAPSVSLSGVQQQFHANITKGIDEAQARATSAVKKYTKLNEQELAEYQGLWEDAKHYMTATVDMNIEMMGKVQATTNGMITKTLEDELKLAIARDCLAKAMTWASWEVEPWLKQHKVSKKQMDQINDELMPKFTVVVIQNPK